MFDALKKPNYNYFHMMIFSHFLFNILCYFSLLSFCHTSLANLNIVQKQLFYFFMSTHQFLCLNCLRYVFYQHICPISIITILNLFQYPILFPASTI